MQESITGCVLGTAVGDAIGLPSEMLARRRLDRLFPLPEQHRLFFGRGMVSDDTEHTLMVAQALTRSAGDVGVFRQSLAKQMKWWLMGLPAGAGKATMRGILRLYAGVSPEKSGVFSAGNGPSMRSALIGVCYGDDREQMRELVRASTRITHIDPKAEFGALAVALAAYVSSKRTVTVQIHHTCCRD